MPTLSTPCNAALAASARPLTAQLLPLQGAAHEAGGGGYDGAGREDDGISLTWEIGRVVFIVVAVRRRPRQPPPPPQRLSSARPPKALTSALFRQVLSLVLGAAFFLGQLGDNQDPDEL